MNDDELHKIAAVIKDELHSWESSGTYPGKQAGNRAVRSVGQEIAKVLREGHPEHVVVKFLSDSGCA